MNTKIILGVVVLAMLAAVASTQAASMEDFDAYAPIFEGSVQPYRLYVPQNYNPRQSYPIILSLHGMGAFGIDNEKQMSSGQFEMVDMVRGTQYDCFIISPQIVGNLGQTWSTDIQFGRALTVLDMVRRKYNIDGQRMHVTGCSMGGNGTWWAGDHYAQYFASVVPLAGWYSTNRASAYITKPLWVFHGGSDGTVSPASDRAMIAAIQALGGSPLYTEYLYGGHVIWPQVYSTPELYPWMFSKVLPTPAPRIRGPLLAYDREPLGDGRYRYTFRIDNDDATLAPYEITVGFKGVDGAVIQHSKFYGAVDVHTETQANIWDGQGTPAYVKAEDSWFCEPFTSNTRNVVNPLDGSLLQGISQGANSFCLAGTTGSANLGTDVPVAQIIADGPVWWYGTIKRGEFTLYLRGETEPADPVNPAIPGDYNADGVVDLADYTVWADHYGQTGPDVAGDGNGDGVVDLADYTVWADHYGQGSN